MRSVRFEPQSVVTKTMGARSVWRVCLAKFPFRSIAALIIQNSYRISRRVPLIDAVRALQSADVGGDLNNFVV